MLRNPRIEIYGCGRRDVRGSRIDRRVLATLEFLAANGLRPTVTSLECGHSTYTASGNVSHHSSGNAVDIAKINGIPVLGHQGKGSITDIAVRRLLTLQGTMQARADHHAHEVRRRGEHVRDGRPRRPHPRRLHADVGTNSKAGRQLGAVLKPGQWIKLIDRLGEIDNPTVRVKPSKAALVVKPRAPAAATAASSRSQLPLGGVGRGSGAVRRRLAEAAVLGAARPRRRRGLYRSSERGRAAARRPTSRKLAARVKRASATLQAKTREPLREPRLCPPRTARRAAAARRRAARLAAHVDRVVADARVDAAVGAEQPREPARRRTVTPSSIDDQASSPNHASTSSTTRSRVSNVACRSAMPWL